MPDDRLRRRTARLVAAPLAGVLLAASASAQTIGPYGRALESWIALPANPGYELPATARIMAASRGWSRDALGNLVKRVGSGTPRRVLACGLDETGYAVSEITDDGYLRLHPAGAGRHVALWDQFHEGQRAAVQVAAASGTVRFVPAVFAVRSTHLWRRRPATEPPTTVEDLWVDVGARSRADVERLGIRMLDPVFREWPRWSYGDLVAGPAAADRAGCAAVVAASDAGTPTRGETIYVVSTQSQFGWTGLTAALERVGPVDSLVLLTSQRTPLRAVAGVRVETTVTLAPPVRFAGTLVESVAERDLAVYAARAARLAALATTPVFPALAASWRAPDVASTRDSLAHEATLLARLTDLYGVSGFEAPVRETVLALLPAWARARATVDSAGDIVLSIGPDRDTAVFVAHMDEIGYAVTRIARDGTVSLRQRGGFYPSLWEGQTALLHRPDERIPPGTCAAAEGGPLRGVFVPRDSATQKEPAELTAWFGVDSAALAAAGVTPGLSVTSFKCATRLGATRFTARAIDDRSGVAALLLALESIAPARLDHKVVFVWSTREEIGLEGARAAAAELGPSVRRVYAIDTFVSSDSPLESARFADVPIGAGVVSRALDNSGVTPPAEVERLARIARGAGVPLVASTTNGGNDGSELARMGAPNGAMGWPSRYSHSPVETMDLRDLRSLGRMIAAVAMGNDK